MHMTFISSSEVKNIYFMGGEATNEIYFFHSMLLCNGVYDDDLSFTIDTYVFFLHKSFVFYLFTY